MTKSEDDKLLDLLLNTEIEFNGENIPYSEFIIHVNEMRTAFDQKQELLYKDCNTFLEKTLDGKSITQYDIVAISIFIKEMTTKANKLWDHKYSNGYGKIEQIGDTIIYNVENKDYDDLKNIFLNSLNALEKGITELYFKSVSRDNDSSFSKN